MHCDPDKRLGSDKRGFTAIKTHRYFNSIDWKNFDSISSPLLKGSLSYISI